MIYKDIAIQLLFSIFLLSSTGIDDKSKNSAQRFATSFATKNNIVNDANKGRSELRNYKASSFAEKRPTFLNPAKQCFPALRKYESSFKLYNLTSETTKVLNLIAIRENLRLYAETLLIKKKIYGFNAALAFFKESTNCIIELHESLKWLIASCHLCAFFKHYVWPIIFKIRSKLFGTRPTKVLRTQKISFLERTDVLPTTPSEKRICVHDDIARDNDASASNNFQCESHVISDDESCDGHVISDHESCDGHVAFDYESCDSHEITDGDTSLNCDLSFDGREISDDEEAGNDVLLESRMNTDDEATSVADSSCDSVDSEMRWIFVEMSPNEFHLIDCYFQPIAEPSEWALTSEYSSQENSTTDDSGTISTGMKSGQDYDVVCDVDSGATSHSYRHSPVSMEMVTCLSKGCEEHQVIEGNDGEFSTDYVEEDSTELQSDYNVMDMIRESEDEESDNIEGECFEQGSTKQQSDIESDTEMDNEDKFLGEVIVNTILKQRLKKHALAAAIFAGTFVLPCFIVAKILKQNV